jgi:hypothetical protein
MQVEISKQYRTVCEYPARIYCTNAGGTLPVHGAVFRDGNWAIETWGLNGRCFGDSSGSGHPHDLIEVKPRIQREVWLNVYERITTIYETRERADANAGTLHQRLACLKITIDCEEGEGL